MIDVTDKPSDLRYITTESTSESLVTKLFEVVDAGLHAPVLTEKNRATSPPILRDTINCSVHSRIGEHVPCSHDEID